MAIERYRAKDFLSDFLDNPRKTELKEELFSIENDQYDKAYHDKIANEMREFESARQELVDFAPDTGYEAFGDLFYSLFKAVPEQVDSKDMATSHMINHILFGEVLKLVDWENLHQYSMADIVAAGLAAVSMEPKLEEIMDRLDVERDKAKELQEMMKEYLEMLLELQQIIEDGEDGEDGVTVLIPGSGDGKEDGGKEDGEGEGNGGKSSDLQDQKNKIEEQMKRLEDEMKGVAEEIDDSLSNTLPGALSAMQQGLKEAVTEASALESACNTWGLDANGLKKISIERRLEIAAMLDNDYLKRVFELMGRFERAYFAEQKRKTSFAREEVYDLELGRDIKRVLPSYLARLHKDSPLRLDFLNKFIKGRLPQYKMRGTEKVAKGGIISCEDGSGSMIGEPEQWAKAISLTGLRIAKAQKREFYAIHFGGTGEIKEFDFRKSNEGIVTTKESRTGHTEKFNYLDGVIDFAETSFHASGTDFVTPLSAALDVLREQYDRFKAVDGDIVFITDGYAGVSNQWLKEFTDEKQRLGFTVFGILIDVGSWSAGGEPQEPLTSICDHIYQISDFASSGDIKSMFGQI